MWFPSGLRKFYKTQQSCTDHLLMQKEQYWCSTHGSLEDNYSKHEWVLDQTDQQNFWSKEPEVKKHRGMPGNSRKP